jgi:hypothetical protein
MTLDEIYTRKLVPREGRWLIESTCQLCGARITDGVSATLHDDEVEHATRLHGISQNPPPTAS